MKYQITLNFVFDRVHNISVEEIEAENLDAAMEHAQGLCAKLSGPRSHYSIATVKTAARANHDRAQRLAAQSPMRPARIIPRSKRDILDGDKITFCFSRSWSRPAPVSIRLSASSWLALIARCRGDWMIARSIVGKIAAGEIANDLP